MTENRFQKSRGVINTITALVWCFTPFIFILSVFAWAGATDPALGGSGFYAEHPFQSALMFLGIFGAPALFIIMTTLFIVIAIIDYVKKRRAKKQIQAKE